LRSAIGNHAPPLLIGEAARNAVEIDLTEANPATRRHQNGAWPTVAAEARPWTKPGRRHCVHRLQKWSKSKPWQLSIDKSRIDHNDYVVADESLAFSIESFAFSIKTRCDFVRAARRPDSITFGTSIKLTHPKLSACRRDQVGTNKQH
jgi:hypothetical protein